MAAMAEYIGFIAGHPLLVAVMVLVTAACSVLCRYIAHRTTIRHEAEATRRMRLAVTGTSSEQRAAVVRACADHEATARSVPRSSYRSRR